MSLASRKPSSLVDTRVICGGDNLEHLPFLKKNGTIHWKKCASHYGASSAATARAWYRCGAPILNPQKMPQWLRTRDDARLKKISAANCRYLDKEERIVHLYRREHMGLRAISRFFSGRPTIQGIRAILIRRGIYRGEDAVDRQLLQSEERRRRIVLRERETRYRIAVCLWRLRKGTGVETTCRQEGWNAKSIWNDLGRRKSYRRFVIRRKRKWPDKRAIGKQYSRSYIAESRFQDFIEGILQSLHLKYVRECRLAGSRTRVDFKLDNGSFIECKVAVNAGQTYEFIGQAFHYRKFTDKIVLCVPDDIEMRKDLHALITEMGVAVCTEFTLAQYLGGSFLNLPSIQVFAPRATRFICKCCGSFERRRHRMNSYCIDCAPRISGMRFDQRRDRWISNGPVAISA
jgi:hypothetical protein